MTNQKVRICKDCLIENPTSDTKRRPANHPGPRCTTHHRAFLKAQKKRNGERRAEKVYGITPEDYQALYIAQNGRCVLCRRVIGINRRAAIDHDHSCQLCGGTGCRECVRGLMDNHCNREVLGWFRDDPIRFEAIVEYLRNPPAKQILRRQA